MLVDEEIADKAVEAARVWYESQRKNPGGGVNTNVMASGIAVAELLRDRFPLAPKDVESKNGSQVKGLSGKLVKNVLAGHGETRKFTVEAGRTSRGTLPMAKDLAEALGTAFDSCDLDERERDDVAEALQAFFVKCIQKDYLDKQKIRVSIDCTKPVSALVGDILDAAQERGDKPGGVVAQHLVGAKLELRFPEANVGRDKASSADMQTHRQGDFELGNTAFHVTVAGLDKLVDRVQENIRDGYRPAIVTTAKRLSYYTTLFEDGGLGDRVCVYSIEAFVGTNVEEMGGFLVSDIRQELKNLVSKYNERIAACEADQSLQIEVPAWMLDMEGTDYGPVEFG